MSGRLGRLLTATTTTACRSHAALKSAVAFGPRQAVILQVASYASKPAPAAAPEEDQPLSKKQQRKAVREQQEKAFQEVVAPASSSKDAAKTSGSDSIKETSIYEPLEWKPTDALPAHKGEFYSMPPGFRTLNDKGIMLRDSTLDIINIINTEAEKSGNVSKILLDGESGTGKSAILSHLASHYKALGWIVIYIPNVSSWTSGEFPYDLPKGSEVYTQPTLTVSILERILSANSAELSKIAVVGDGVVVNRQKIKGSLADVAQAGIKFPDHAHTALYILLNQLEDHSSKRPPVLFAIDQINTFYTTTQYYDRESKALTADRLATVAPFLRLLAAEKLQKTVIVGAMDRTHSTIKSRFLEHVSNSVNNVNKSAKPPIGTSKYQDLSHIGTFGVLLPEVLAPAATDPFIVKSEVHPKNLVKYSVPVFSRAEIDALLRNHQKRKFLLRNKVDNNLVDKLKMVTGGNAREIVKFYNTI
ncbi:28S ribosomal protein S29, mitochondrial [Chytridiales sp. JEL 0842]|nr:28S ribosomal protein S29, mitochondrial [Chytridiales sp. JEL 0842]